MNFKSEETRKSALDAAKRGHATVRERHQKVKDNYYLNPLKCVCGNVIPFEKRTKSKFCSKVCAWNNMRRPKRKKEKLCLNCGLTLNKNNNKFCSIKCSSEYSVKTRQKNALENLSNGTLDDQSARHWFRKLVEHKCSICGIDTWMGKEVPLVVDHIDGDHSNNKLINLRFVCCNCDAQLPTYKSKNRGKGRIYRRLIL